MNQKIISKISFLKEMLVRVLKSIKREKIWISYNKCFFMAPVFIAIFLMIKDIYGRKTFYASDFKNLRISNLTFNKKYFCIPLCKILFPEKKVNEAWQ